MGCSCCKKGSCYKVDRGDNLRIKAPVDRRKINTSQPWEMAYWKKKLGVSGQAIVGAMRATRSSEVKTIRAYLKR